ncbi:YicC/YloC family endoribonuclease [Thermosulfuriphilus sp.]
MALKSMTGFARASRSFEGWRLTVELKSLNHRFLDIVIRLPKRYSPLEDRLRRELAARVSRGRLELSIQISGLPREVQVLSCNWDLARSLLTILKTLKAELGLEGEVTLAQVASFRDIIVPTEEEADLEALWRELYPVFEEALEDLISMRVREGEALYKDLKGRLQEIEGLLAQIGHLWPQAFEGAKKRLEERLTRALANIEYDSTRLAQEMAIMADKMDIHEEMVRLHSHIGQFYHYLESLNPVGRRLDFLVQEMFREVNTLSNKAQDAQINHLAVEIKGELERLREQIQNVE